LTDGIEPTFDEWSKLVAAKLEGKYCGYPTDQHKCDYIFACIGGAARRAINPYHRVKSKGCFTKPRQYIKALAGAFDETDKKGKAGFRYQQCFMKDSQDVRDFRTELMNFASIAEISPRQQAQDIYRKLPRMLRTPLRAYAGSKDKRVEELSIRKIWNKLMEIENGAQEEQAIELERKHRLPAKEPVGRPPFKKVDQPKESKPTSSGSYISMERFRGKSDTPAPFKARTPTPHARQSRTPGAPQLCYNCDQPGHYAGECPEPKKGGGDIRQIEGDTAAEGSDEGDHADDEISGNERP